MRASSTPTARSRQRNPTRTLPSTFAGPTSSKTRSERRPSIHGAARQKNIGPRWRANRQKSARGVVVGAVVGGSGGGSVVAVVVGGGCWAVGDGWVLVGGG